MQRLQTTGLILYGQEGQVDLLVLHICCLVYICILLFPLVPFIIILPSSRYDWHTVERDVKLNIIYPSIWKSHDQRVKIHCSSCSVNAFDLEVYTQCTLR